MGKRKRADMGQNGALDAGVDGALKGKKEEQPIPLSESLGEINGQNPSTTMQIIVGTYDKVVHGLTATLSKKSPNGAPMQFHVEFVDTFLLRAHDAAVRCLALSPQKSNKILLASGSSDQVIQVYQLSTQIPSPFRTSDPPLLSSAGSKAAVNSRNKTLGALELHEGVVNTLCFPSRSKLLSAADDCTIAVMRTRDWTVLSTIKAPIPKALGRPSGDTAPLGGTPAGVNDFAIHPSMKLMVSVGKGEKCMRLWNLVTGKKAGVLNFERSILQGVGEGKWTSGEGRRVRWNSIGEEFVVAFDRGCLVYGIDSQPKFRIFPEPPTKIHQIRYMAMPKTEAGPEEILAISTEDGRIIFYSTDSPSAIPKGDERRQEVELLQPIAYFGGAPDGLAIRIKDFEVLRPLGSMFILIITCCSDGAIRLWLIENTELMEDGKKTSGTTGQRVSINSDTSNESGLHAPSSQPIGQLIGLYESKHRITCLAAFLMSEPIAGEAIGLPNGGASSFDEENYETIKT